MHPGHPGRRNRPERLPVLRGQPSWGGPARKPAQALARPGPGPPCHSRPVGPSGEVRGGRLELRESLWWALHPSASAWIVREGRACEPIAGGGGGRRGLERRCGHGSSLWGAGLWNLGVPAPDPHCWRSGSHSGPWKDPPGGFGLAFARRSAPGRLGGVRALLECAPLPASRRRSRFSGRCHGSRPPLGEAVISGQISPFRCSESPLPLQDSDVAARPLGGRDCPS